MGQAPRKNSEQGLCRAVLAAVPKVQLAARPACSVVDVIQKQKPLLDLAIRENDFFIHSFINFRVVGPTMTI